MTVLTVVGWGTIKKTEKENNEYCCWVAANHVLVLVAWQHSLLASPLGLGVNQRKVHLTCLRAFDATASASHPTICRLTWFVDLDCTLMALQLLCFFTPGYICQEPTKASMARIRVEHGPLLHFRLKLRPSPTMSTAMIDSLELLCGRLWLVYFRGKVGPLQKKVLNNSWSQSQR